MADEDGERPLVSAVLITYDRPEMFRAALDSVLDQTYPNLEVVVVDGSEPPVESILRRRVDGALPARYRRDDGEGAAAARNVGIRAATGEYVAFLDDDDRWLPEKIERQVEAFGPDVGTVYTGQRIVTDGESVGGRTPTLGGDVTERLLRGVACCPTSTVMVRRDTIDRAGLFDVRFSIWEDREWYVRLSEYGEFAPVPEPLVLRRRGTYGQLTDDFAHARDVAYPLFLDKHRSLAADHGCERQLIASLSRMLGAVGLEAGCHRAATRSLFRALRHDPYAPATYLYLLLALGGSPVYDTAQRVKQEWHRKRGPTVVTD